MLRGIGFISVLTAPIASQFIQNDSNSNEVSTGVDSNRPRLIAGLTPRGLRQSSKRVLQFDAHSTTVVQARSGGRSSAVHGAGVSFMIGA
jgi:hypothetical protein